MNREISTPVDSELNNDALITEIREIRKEVHTLVEKISVPLERIAIFFLKNIKITFSVLIKTLIFLRLTMRIKILSKAI